MSTPELFDHRYALRRYTARDFLGTAQDSTRIEVLDTQTGSSVVFHDRGGEGLDAVSVNGLDVQNLETWRMLYHGIRKHVRHTVPQDIYQTFRGAENISLHQQWNKGQWQSNIKAGGDRTSGLHVDFVHMHTERLAPFTPTTIQITRTNPPLFIRVTQDPAIAWLTSTLHALALDRVLTAATTLAIPLQLQKFNVGVSVGLYHTLPTTRASHATPFLAELELALEGMMGFPKGDETFLSFPSSRAESAEAPLPNFRRVPLPAATPPRLRALIDADGDGFVSHINEAWRATLLATPGTAWDAISAAALQQVTAQLTHVASDKSSLRIGPHVFHINRPDAPTCATTKRLFAVGEAIRSFGDNLTRQWAEGALDEAAIRILPLSPGNITDGDTRVALWGTADKQDLRAAALYAADLNTLVTGCSATLSDQYRIARHELGHVLDDTLFPFDMHSSAPVIYSKHPHNAIAHGGLACAPEQLPSPQYHDPTEWLAFFMESSDHWRLASPALRAIIACAVDAAAPYQCTGDQPLGFPAEMDAVGFDRRDIELHRTVRHTR